MFIQGDNKLQQVTESYYKLQKVTNQVTNKFVKNQRITLYCYKVTDIRKKKIKHV